MTRFEAYQVLSAHLKNPNLIKHSLATEAAMQGLCRYILGDPSPDVVEEWGITGLLHDADYEETTGHPEIHGIKITEELNLPDHIAYAIQGHNFQYTKVMPESPMDWAIASCDQLTGLIVACALVHPDKKLNSLTPDFVMKRFYEKSFAKGAGRDTILLCESKLNIPLIKFIEVVLKSMQEISGNLGL